MFRYIGYLASMIIIISRTKALIIINTSSILPAFIFLQLSYAHISVQNTRILIMRKYIFTYISVYILIFIYMRYMLDDEDFSQSEAFRQDAVINRRRTKKKKNNINISGHCVCSSDTSAAMKHLRTIYIYMIYTFSNTHTFRI